MEVNSIQELELILRMEVEEHRVVEKSKKRHSVSQRKPKQGEANPNQFAVSTAPFAENNSTKRLFRKRTTQFSEIVQN